MVWTKRPREWKKVNLDAAVFATQGIIGVGSVVRDSKGAMVMDRTTPILGAYQQGKPKLCG